jgi:predicted dehydrogenase
MEKIRWGLIGCGDIARKRVAPALVALEKSSLHAIARSHAELAQSFAKEFGAKTWYVDWRDLIRDPEIDAVYIATPVALHAEQTIAAAKQGKHVLCEKPMALSAKECRRMMHACKRQGVTLGIAYYRHMYPVILRIKEIFASGEVGKPLLAGIKAFENFNPPLDHPRHWILEKRFSGGGPMKDFGCHRIEVLLNIFGRARRVTPLLQNLRWNREVEDTACVAIEFSDALGLITVSHAVLESADTLDIYCTEGSIHVPSLNEGTLLVVTRDTKREERCPPHANLHLPLIEAFIDSLLGRKDFAVPGETGLEVERIEDIIYSQKRSTRL